MELLKKSAYNFQSADKLIKCSLFAPSIHCSYYSCFQHVVVKTIFHSNRTHADLEAELIRMKGKTHTFYLSKLLHYYEKKGLVDTRNRRGLKSLYENLKNKRIDADYHNSMVDEAKANEAFDYCKKINDFLKSN